MKTPTEAELIDVENFMSRWQPDRGPVLFASEELYQHHRVWNTLRTLIALARDPSRLELTEEELTCLWAALSVLDMNRPSVPVSAAHAKVDAGLVSVLAKLDKLMQGPKL